MINTRITWPILSLILPTPTFAQVLLDGTSFQCDTNAQEVVVTPIRSDSSCSSFHICIPARVPLHMHLTHTEHVMVLSGSGIMRLGNERIEIDAGDLVVIPAGAPHAVEVSDGGTLQVISIQAPYFDGSDRVLLPEE